MKLLIDHRERHLRGQLENICDEVVFAQLPIGDYLIACDTEAILVERKTSRDFLSSLRSNRLWDQLLRMMKTERVLGYHVKRRFLVSHGSFGDLFEMFGYKTQDEMLIRWSRLMGAFLEVICVYNTPIVYVENDQAFKAFMKILIKREFQGKNDKFPEARWYKKPAKSDLPVKDRRQYVLSSLPHIGERLAENLLLHFSTISDVACASVKELQEVPKIGKKKAELIYHVFH